MRAPAGAPNIVIILLDDVGFGASSTFGGPAITPELDRLAHQGLRYNRFHVTALCSPTRAALLSGRNDHQLGFGTVTDQASGFPGYDGIWKKNTASVADILRRNGYSTAAFGKWHNTPFWEISPVGPFDHWPTGLGFEYFYGFMNGEDSQWEPSLYRNTTPVAPLETPGSEYHLTADLTDDAIRWMHTHESLAPDKPYFLYFATGATHAPHHVPVEWIAKYRGQFDQGWDQLRKETFIRQKRLGVIPQDTELTPRPRQLPAWSSLSADRRKFLARQMEIYAAYLSHTDFEVGRLLKAVRSGQNGDNTLIFYIVGDNGASGEGGLWGDDGDDWGVAGNGAEPLDHHRLTHLEELGGRRLFNNYAAAWAWSTDTPFQYTKQVASHFGATRDPLVISWPVRIKDTGGLRSQFTAVNDVAATIYEVTGIAFPNSVDGVLQKPLDGVSFAYSFGSASAPSRHLTQVFEQAGNRSIYENGWVAGAVHWLPWTFPYDDGHFDRDRWELYHVDTDFSEAHDLAARYPQKLKDMKALFEEQARVNNILPLGAGGPDMAIKQQPSPIKGLREFTFHVDLPRTPDGFVTPDFRLAHRITANLVIPDETTGGVIIADGSRYAGFVLYVMAKHLIYENALGDAHDVITSDIPLPTGKIEVVYEFSPALHQPASANWWENGGPGIGRLYVNGKIVGEAQQGPVLGWGSLGIGQVYGSTASSAFTPPFKFTGILDQVKVEMR